MLKKAFFSCLIVLTLITNIFTLPVFAEPGENGEISTSTATVETSSNTLGLKAKSYLLMDAETGNIMLEYNIHEKLPIASITKIMSLLLIMESIDSAKLTFDDMVHVTEHSYSMGGSQVYLKPGEEFTVRDMLKAVAIHSANDATVALGEKVAGSEDAFVAMMNQKAKDLGMENTNFLDATGLTDEGHFSTAHDIAIMSRELISKHPKILEFTRIWMDSFRNGEFELVNTNKLVRFYDGANGIKTGFTNAAGYCLSATATRNNLQLISVVLGSSSNDSRFSESRKLLDYGFANYESTMANSKGEVIREIEVKKGLKTIIKAVYKEDVKLIVKKGEKDNIVRDIKIEQDIIAPVKAGQKVGEVIYKLNDGREVGKAEVVADRDIQRASFIKLFYNMVLEWFSVGR